jgi:hypothetical protein
MFEAATGNKAAKTDEKLTYDASTGILTAFGGYDGSIIQASQTNITSLGTLTILRVDNIQLNGSTITGMTDANTVLTAYAGRAIAVEGVSFDAGAVTGVTTLSMNNQLTNTLAIGTAPMVITSTTKVANLNVEQVDGADLDTTVTLGTSDVKVPSQNAVKRYVDAMPVLPITHYGKSGWTFDEDYWYVGKNSTTATMHDTFYIPATGNYRMYYWTAIDSTAGSTTIPVHLSIGAVQTGGNYAERTNKANAIDWNFTHSTSGVVVLQTSAAEYALTAGDHVKVWLLKDTNVSTGGFYIMGAFMLRTS